MHITFTQPVPWFSTPLRLLSKLLRFRTLWAYGFDSAAPRAPKKSKLGEKEKTFFLQPTRAKSGVRFPHLTYLVYLVYLADLVYLVYLVCLAHMPAA